MADEPIQTAAEVILDRAHSVWKLEPDEFGWLFVKLQALVNAVGLCHVAAAPIPPLNDTPPAGSE